MQDFKKAFKNYIQGICFCGIFICILLGMSRVMIRYSMKNNEFVYKRNEAEIGMMKEPENTIDLLVVGNSLSYTSISPYQIYMDQGITSYDLCESQQQVQESYFILKKAFETQKPKVVTLDATVLFKADGQKDNYDILIAEKANELFPAIQFHDIWKPVLTKVYWTDEPTYKGYLFRDISIPYTGGNYMEDKGKKEKISKNAMSYLMDMKTMCEENGAEMILIATPSPEDWSYAKHVATEKAAKEAGLAFYDMNEEVDKIGINWETDSFDGGEHLNLIGSKKVTAYFEDHILQSFHLPDHRGEKGYENWSQGLEEYQQREEYVRNLLRGSLGI